MKKVLVFSHKEVWKSEESPTGWATDGGFVFHMVAVGSLFDQIEVMVPQVEKRTKGEIQFKDNKLTISPIFLPENIRGWKRKLYVVKWGLLNFGKLRKKIKAADIVHVPIPSDFGTIGMLLAKWMGKPLYIRHCGNWLAPKTRLEHFWKGFMIKHAGQEVVALATGGGEQAPTAENTQVKWIFSTSLMQKELEVLRQRAENKEHNPHFNIAIVARQVEKKGTGTVLEAIAKLNNPAIRFDVVGDGEDLINFKELAKQLNIEEQVHFHGKLNNTEVINRLLKADIFCFPTRSSEGFPKVVLEAMACGLPVITNPVSVLPNLVGDSSSGIILKEGTPEELATVIKEFAENSEKRASFSKNALDTAQQYSLENWADYIGKELTSTFKEQVARKRALVK